MAPSRQKGNIGTLLIVLTTAAFAVLVSVAAWYMIFNGNGTGKYTDPEVAQQVIDGSVFDRNGRVLSMSAPVYGSRGEISAYERTYPAAFHAAQLISETERVFAKRISPAPGFNESITYGQSVKLTLDFDIQYLLDLAVQNVRDAQQPAYVTAFILDARTGEVLACSTCPFYDLNADPSPSTNRSYVTSFEFDGELIRPWFVSAFTDSRGNVIEDGTALDLKALGFTADMTSTLAMISRAASSNSAVLTGIPESDPRYLLFIGSWNPKYGEQDKSVMENAVREITEGLLSQGKLQNSSFFQL